MIKFFRKIRQELISEGKTEKYLKYAVGEIILVVIGILIALQINNWNLDRQEQNKEQTYLQEIRKNLYQDSLKLQAVLDFNRKKVRIVEEMLQIFSDTLSNEDRFRIFNENANDFTYYEVFDPVRIAFNNMLSAENIDLISKGDLREALSKYYNFPYLDGIQNRISVLNRQVVDDFFPKFFTKEFASDRLGIATNMPSVVDLDIARDQELLSILYGISIIISVQNELILDTQIRNQELASLLDSEIQK